MEVGLYSHGEVPISFFDMVTLYLEDKGLGIDKKGCLCEKDLSQKLPEVVICHPDSDDEDGCLSRVREVIIRKPETRFYILATGFEKRQEVIGKHSNLTYLEGMESFESFRGKLQNGTL